MLDKITSAPTLAAALEKLADLALRIYEDTGVRRDLEETSKTQVFSIEYGDYIVALQVIKKQEAAKLPEETND